MMALLVQPKRALSAASVAITSPTAGATLPVGSVAVSGTAGANQTVVISRNGVPVTSVIANGSGNWSTTLNNLTEGSVTLAAKAIENDQYAYFASSGGSNVMNRIRITDNVINPGGGSWPAAITDFYLIAAGINTNGKAYFVQAGVAAAAPGQFDVNSPADFAPVIGYPSNPNLSIGAMSLDGTKWFGVNTDLDSVSVVDVATNTYSGTSIAVGDAPQSVGVDSDGMIHVSNSNDNTISVINPSTNVVDATLPISCPSPNAVGAVSFPSADTSYFYVACAGDGVIQKVNAATGATLSTFDISGSHGNISSMMISPDNSRLYVSGIFGSGFSDQIAVVNTDDGSIEAIIALTNDTIASILSPDGQYLYVNTIGLGFTGTTIDVVSTVSNTVVETIDTSAVGLPGLVQYGQASTATDSVTFNLLSVSSTSDDINTETLADTGQSRTPFLLIVVGSILMSLVFTVVAMLQPRGRKILS